MASIAYVFVNCRVGSLEMRQYRSQSSRCVNCRVGSLEKIGGRLYLRHDVNCRVGSLERELKTC